MPLVLLCVPNCVYILNKDFLHEFWKGRGVGCAAFGFINVYLSGTSWSAVPVKRRKYRLPW